MLPQLQAENMNLKSLYLWKKRFSMKTCRVMHNIVINQVRNRLGMKGRLANHLWSHVVRELLNSRYLAIIMSYYLIEII